MKSLKKVNTFNQVVYLKSLQGGDNLTNRKTKPWLSPIQYIEVITLPLSSLVLGKEMINKENGGLTQIMREVCSKECRYLVNALRPQRYKGMKGICNQSRPLNHWGAQVKRIYENEALNVLPLHDSYQIRVSVFGDIGSLNEEGLNFIENLIDNSTSHLAYSADWRKPKMQRFKRKVQASVFNIADAMEAFSLGWRGYGLTREDLLKVRLLTNGEVKAYSCPYDTKTLKGCSVCEVRCDAKKWVSLKGHK